LEVRMLLIPSFVTSPYLDRLITDMHPRNSVRDGFHLYQTRAVFCDATNGLRKHEFIRSAIQF
jgi:hypothetical protein